MSRSFALGALHATPAAVLAAEDAGVDLIYLILSRHSVGDWGDLDEEDRRANDAALLNGSRLLSAYQYGDHRFWVITEADRSATTVLLPEEY